MIVDNRRLTARVDCVQSVVLYLKFEKNENVVSHHCDIPRKQERRRHYDKTRHHDKKMNNNKTP